MSTVFANKICLNQNPILNNGLMGRAAKDNCCGHLSCHVYRALLIYLEN